MLRVAAFALVALAVHVGLGLLVQHHGPLGIDTAAFDVIQPFENATGRHVIRVFTDIGSFPVIGVVAIITAVFAARAGRREQAAMLVLGAIAVVLLNTVAKHIWDRSRPVARYYDPQGTSFPSGHSAQAITYLAAARTVGSRRLVVAAVVLALAIGGSRLYLHVHYLTDVLGGFALGAAFFAPVLAKT